MSNHIVNMSKPLTRAFTTRRQRTQATEITPAPYVGRAASQRSPHGKPIKRSEISLPVALISTTNMLSYEAPDIVGTTRIASERSISSSSSVTSSNDSGHESDGGSSTGGRARSTMTDASSVDEPSSPVTPELNHLSCYFKPGVSTSESPSRSNSTFHSAHMSLDNSPSIPQRALSHSKKAHFDLSRKRSVIRAAQPQSQELVRDPLGIFGAHASTEQSVSHPFGKELEQLNEVQEEFGNTVRNAEAEADLAVLHSRGLAQFCAADYMQELTGLYATAFDEDKFTFPQWI